MHVREATPDDSEAVRTVHRESILGLGPVTYSDEQVQAWARGVEGADYEAAITDGDTYFVVAEAAAENSGKDVATSPDAGEDAATSADAGEDVASGDVLAFGSLAETTPEGYEADVDVEVTGVYVHPDAARQGVGSAVLADLERRARELSAERLGLTASLNAVAFYETHGYERVRERAHEFSAALSTGVEGTVVEMCGEP